MRFTFVRASVLLLLSFSAWAQVRAQEAAGRTEILKGTVQLVETKEQSESTFKADVVAKGLFAVLLTLSNPTEAVTASIRRADALVRTEFDEQLAALEAQRVYDRLMMPIGGGPAFAEYGIGRAIGEGARKRTLRETILQKALPETIELGPGQSVEGVLFFERGKHTGSLAYSTLVICDVLRRADGRRVSFSLSLGAQK
jgi:hypothetical protein